MPSGLRFDPILPPPYNYDNLTYNEAKGCGLTPFCPPLIICASSVFFIHTLRFDPILPPPYNYRRSRAA